MFHSQKYARNLSFLVKACKNYLWRENHFGTFRMYVTFRFIMKWYQRFSICLSLFFSLVIGRVIYLERDFLSSIYEITQFEDRFYQKELTSDGGVKYTQVNEKPADWVEFKNISKNIKGAILVSEDGKFYRHQGYDPESLRDRIYDVFVLKRKLKGGSTITQQLVKNLYLSKDKTLSRKGRELILTIILEKYASKDKIYETYLNSIEYGKNLYGIKTAAQFYFKKPAKELRAREAAFLAMLLPNPVRYSRSFKNKTLSRYARRQVDSILLRMRQNNFIGPTEYESNINGHMGFERYIPVEEKIDGNQEEEEIYTFTSESSSES